MKKYLGIVIFVISFFAFSQEVFAESINISCKKQVCYESGCELKNFTEVDGSDILFCDLGYNSNNSINKISADLKLSDGLEYLEFSNAESSWAGDFNSTGINISTVTPTPVNNSFLKLKLRVTTAKPETELSIQMTNIKMESAGKDLKTSNGKFNFKVNECSTGLDNLSILDVEYTPKFDIDTLDYQTETYKDEFSIQAYPLCYDSDVSYKNTISLQLGNQRYPISVTSPTEGVRTYYVYINRLDNTFLRNKLYTLSSDQGKIEFQPDVYYYYMDVANDVETIDFEYTVTDNTKSTVTIVGNEKLSMGSNTVGIKVTPNYDLQKEGVPETLYTILVNRKEKLSLNNLSITDFPFEFSSDVFEYRVNSKNFTEEILTEVEVNFDKADENNEVKVTGNSGLKRGKNIISVMVSDDVGQQTEYIIEFHQPTYTWIIILVIVGIVLIGAGIWYYTYLQSKKPKTPKYRGYVKPE